MNLFPGEALEELRHEELLIAPWSHVGLFSWVACTLQKSSKRSVEFEGLSAISCAHDLFDLDIA